MMKYDITQFIDELEERLEELEINGVIMSANKLPTSKRELLRQRQKYVENWERNRDTHAEQLQQYETATNQFYRQVSEHVAEMLQPELGQFNARVSVQDDRWYRGQSTSYVIQISHNDEKKNSSKRLRDSHGWNSYYQGISFEVYIYFKFDRETDTISVVKEPQIATGLLESSDYNKLKLIYEFLVKIEGIDWETELNNIIENSPKEENYVTTEAPGMRDTSIYDDAIKDHDILATEGTDLWIFMDRDCSADGRYNHSKGWMQVVSHTPKFYEFRWINCYNPNKQFNQYFIHNVLQNTYKAKKFRFSIVEPLQYRSTEELTMDPEDLEI